MAREPHREPHKFDPAKAGRLESPERQKILPSGRVVELLALQGVETVVDYGAGSGVLTLPVAESLPGGVVYAVDESREMFERLEERLSGTSLSNVYPKLIENNHTNLANNSVDRVLMVNVLHEVIGEGALAEIHRLLKPNGFLLVIDWRSDVKREMGPPADVSLTPEEGAGMLEEAGFVVAAAEDEGFPYHFVFAGRMPEIT